MKLNNLAIEIDKFARAHGKPYYVLEVRVKNLHDEIAVEYSCYIDPIHKTHDEFPTPEDLLAAVRAGVSRYAIDQKVPREDLSTLG